MAASTPAPTSRLTVGVCGTTARTLACAQSLSDAPNFTIEWVITPIPRPVGRNQEIQPTPLDSWAQSQRIPTLHVNRSLKEIRDQVAELPPVDYLLVVDFGYLVPRWLLELPRIAPINVHPSTLPKYRGSSPAQYALLYGETESSVTIMQMDVGMDTGPIIQQIPFAVRPQETQASYYQTSFRLAADQLPQTLQQFANNPTPQPQLTDSPTPTANRLNKDDGFVPFALVAAATAGQPTLNEAILTQLSPTLQQVWHDTQPTPAVFVDRIIRALHPWPGAWTVAPKRKKRTNVRCKLLAGQLTDTTADTTTNSDTAPSQQLIITRWQFDGEQPIEGQLDITSLGDTSGVQ